MRKKIIIFIILVSSFLFTIKSYAESLYNEKINYSYFEEYQDISLTERKIGRSITDLLKNNNYSDDKIQILMEQYYKIAAIYPISNSTMTEIVELVDEGADILKLLDIYVFLSDSNASLSYMSDMYYAGEATNFYGSYWIEDAFNCVADQENNILSINEINTLTDQGVSIEDVKTADILSRSEKMSTKEILIQRQEGMTWGNIIKNIYENLNLSGLENVESSTDILECIRLSKFTGETVNNVYNDYVNDKYDAINKRIIPKIKSAEDIIKSEGLNVMDTNEYLNQIALKVNNSISEENIKDLIEERYTEDEILKAIDICSTNKDMDINDILSIYRNENYWYGESKEGEVTNE